MNTSKTNIYKRIYKVTFLTMILSIFAQIYFSNTQALKSKDLVAANFKREANIKEIAQLNYQKSNEYAISKVEERAKQLGFIAFAGNVSVIKSSSFASAFTFER